MEVLLSVMVEQIHQKLQGSWLRFLRVRVGVWYRILPRDVFVVRVDCAPDLLQGALVHYEESLVQNVHMPQ